MQLASESPPPPHKTDLTTRCLKSFCPFIILYARKFRLSIGPYFFAASARFWWLRIIFDRRIEVRQSYNQWYTLLDMYCSNDEGAECKRKALRTQVLWPEEIPDNLLQNGEYVKLPEGNIA